MVYFQIIEEIKTKYNKYGDARQAWMKLSRNFEPTVGASKIKLCTKFAKCELDDITRNSE